MKVCVFGAGAIGGFVAASLAKAGHHKISAVVRGGRLAALKASGLTVRVGGKQWQAPIHVTDNPTDLGAQDFVFVTLKAPTVEPAVESIKALLAPNTTVVFLMNGIPWWYYYKHGSPHEGQRIARLDPLDKIWNTIQPERVLGGVAYCSATVTSPGVIDLDYPEVRFEFGEPDGSISSRLHAVVDMTNAAGINSALTPNIRERVWAKLLLNIATGPSAILAQSPLRDLFAQDAIRESIKTMLIEALAIARSTGMNIALDIEAAVSKMSKSGHKPSILQDLEAGRPMEIDALYAVALDMGHARGVVTPMLDGLVGLSMLRAQRAGLYAAVASVEKPRKGL